MGEKPRMIIVDKNDDIVGYKRGALEKGDIYRVSALWITNSKKEILLAKRHRSKVHHPEKWGPGVAGTVEEGETYESNIIKEAEEELGLKSIKPILGPKTETLGKYHHFTQWFTLVVDREAREFTLQEDEVEEVQWVSPEKLLQQIDEYPDRFLPTMKKYVELFL